MSSSVARKSGDGPIWRQFVIGQTFGVAFAVLLFLIEPVWLMGGSHAYLGASLTSVLGVYGAFGWVLGAGLGVVFGLVGAVFSRLRRADGTVAGLGPVIGFVLMALFIVRFESPQTLRTVPTTIMVSLGAAVLVWVGLGYLGRRFLARYVPVARRPVILKSLGLIAFATFVVPVVLSQIQSTRLPRRTPESDNSPNIVLVVVDALRPDHLSAYGYDRITSPNLDRFADGAVVFEKAYSHGNCAELAMPSLWTSKYPAFIERSDRGEVTIADLCRSAGYTTVCLSSAALLEAVPRMSQGFDEVADFHDLRFGLSIYRALAYLGLVEPPTHPPHFPGAASVTDRGIAWIERVKDRPFFLFLNYADAQPPYTPPAEYDAVFGSGGTDVQDQLLFMKAEALGAGSASVQLDAGELERIVDLYDATIRYVDEEIGRLMTKLESEGLGEKTIVIVTADRGVEFLEHGGLFDSRLATEETIRVPLIIGKVSAAGPGRKASTVARHVDLLPTVAALIGSEMPVGINGSSLVPLLSGNKKDDSRVTIAEGDDCVSLNTKRWKILYLDASDAYRLYDLSVDRLGRSDVSVDYGSQQVEMKSLLEEYLDVRAGKPVIEEKLMTGQITN
jgi:arylsulfatase A-like enzyme